MATLKPTTPLLAPKTGPLKPMTPLRPKNAPKTPISHSQRRWRFQSHTGTSEQRRSRFQTTGPPGLQGLAAASVGGGGAWLDNVPTVRTTRQHARSHWCGGRRRARLRCPWAVVGPGRASRRRAEPTARGADGSRAGRRPRAHQAARPHRTARVAPGTPVGPQVSPGRHSTQQHTARGPKRLSASGPSHARASVAHRLS